jgi:hypothetical protein
MTADKPTLTNTETGAHTWTPLDPCSCGDPRGCPATPVGPDGFTRLAELLDTDARLVRMAKAQALREAAGDCPGGPRHYYAVDATCQHCEMPSWVEARLRARADSLATGEEQP